jgi:murein DD-endopeptidase MepM/ murein hydrolase activator NlpD
LTKALTRRGWLAVVAGGLGGSWAASVAGPLIGTVAVGVGGPARAGGLPRDAQRRPSRSDGVRDDDHARGPALRVSAGVARTGKLVVVTVAAPPTGLEIAALSATLGTRAGTAWPTNESRRTWRALVAVDIEETASSLPLVVEAQRADGSTTSSTSIVRIRPGRYDRRSISVGKQFTSPSAEEQERAARESEELVAALRLSSSTRLWRGRFVRPTPGPETAPFGTLRTYNKKRRSRHLGLDLDGAVGAPIVAANHGRVLLAAERFYSGGTVLLDHGEGLVTMYFHMSRIDVVVGQELARGAGLGSVGASGQVTGPHLHLTVRLGGCSVDPAQLLALDLSDDAEDRKPLPSSPASSPQPSPSSSPSNVSPR